MYSSTQAENGLAYTVGSGSGTVDLRNYAKVDHTHELEDVKNASSIISNKADLGHKHTVGEINNLDIYLNDKANVAHTHDLNTITNLENLSRLNDVKISKLSIDAKNQDGEDVVYTSTVESNGDVSLNLNNSEIAHYSKDSNMWLYSGAISCSDVLIGGEGTVEETETRLSSVEDKTQNIIEVKDDMTKFKGAINVDTIKGVGLGVFNSNLLDSSDYIRFAVGKEEKGGECFVFGYGNGSAHKKYGYMKILEGSSSMTFWNDRLELSGPLEIRKDCKFTDEVTMNKSLVVEGSIGSNASLHAPIVTADVVSAATINATNTINAPNIIELSSAVSNLNYLCSVLFPVGSVYISDGKKSLPNGVWGLIKTENITYTLGDEKHETTINYYIRHA